MAPTKKDTKEEKEAKLTPEQSTTLILDYLRKQNRPYSAVDISTNLKNRVTKAAAAKLLKDLHERNDIEGRAAGKQIVYHAIQDENESISPDSLQALDEETTRLKEATVSLKAEEKGLRALLRENVLEVPTADLKADVASLEAERDELKTRLERIAKGGAQPVSVEERDRINVEHRKWQKVANARKKIRGELWKVIADALPKEKLEETKEGLGLEF